MPDLDQDLPSRNELSWKALFASTEIERSMAQQLLDAGLCRPIDEHKYLTEIRMDPTGTAGDDSPLGQLAKSIVDSQPIELHAFAEEMSAILLTPPDPPVHKPEPEPAPEPELGTSMKKLARLEKPIEPSPKAWLTSPSALHLSSAKSGWTTRPSWMSASGSGNQLD
jgi:hypothetical protein